MSTLNSQSVVASSAGPTAIRASVISSHLRYGRANGQKRRKTSRTGTGGASGIKRAIRDDVRPLRGQIAVRWTDLRGRAPPRRVLLELAAERAQTLLGQRDERARARRQVGAAAPDQREGVVARLGEGHPAQGVGDAGPQREQQPPADDRVAQAAPRELDGGLGVLDVDLRLEGHPRALRELG